MPAKPIVFIIAASLAWLVSPLAIALPIVVDPATPLTGTFAVEWNSVATLKTGRRLA
jgi:hypothetical protein